MTCFDFMGPNLPLQEMSAHRHVGRFDSTTDSTPQRSRFGLERPHETGTDRLFYEQPAIPAAESTFEPRSSLEQWFFGEDAHDSQTSSVSLMMVKRRVELARSQPSERLVDNHIVVILDMVAESTKYDTVSRQGSYTNLEHRTNAQPRCYDRSTVDKQPMLVSAGTRIEYSEEANATRISPNRPNRSEVGTTRPEHRSCCSSRPRIGACCPVTR